MNNHLPCTAHALERLSVAAFFIAFCAFSSGANAQKTFKCGNSYSQTPCGDGKTIETPDKRSDEQKLQAEKVTRDTEKSVKKLAAERKTRERNERAQLRADKAAEKVEADKKKVSRTPFTPYFGKKLKPEKPVQPPKQAKPIKPPKPAKPPKTSNNPA